MSIVLGGRKHEVEGTVSWLDDQNVPRATNTNRRTTWIRAIVLHTVHGKLGPLRQGIKPSTRAEAYAKYQAATKRMVSWDYTVDTDGTIVVSNDPLERYTWHAGLVNRYTVGIELVQDSDGSVYAGQIDALVRLVDFLTRVLGIQRQVPARKGVPIVGVLDRLTARGGAGADVCGVYGHRNVTPMRGAGDPGDHPFRALLDAGYEGFDFDAGEDLHTWTERQKRLGLRADGVPGAQTRRALEMAGYSHGLWVHRPTD